MRFRILSVILATRGFIESERISCGVGAAGSTTGLCGPPNGKSGTKSKAVASPAFLKVPIPDPGIATG